MNDVLTRSALIAGALTGTRFRAVAASTRPVSRFDNRGVRIDEILDVTAPGAVESFVGKPLLDSHNTGSVRAAIGTIVHAERDGETVVIEAELSTADDVLPIRQRIEDKTIQCVSVGYRVTKWRRDGSTHTATRWAATEVSLVVNPADKSARIIRSTEGDTMTPEERARHRAEIRSLTRSAGLSSDFADACIDEELDADAVKARIFDELQKRPAKPIIRTHGGGGYEDPAVFRRAAAGAMAHRMGVPELAEESRPFAHVRAMDLMRQCVERAGVSTRGMSETDLTRAAMTTSDYPAVVTDAMHNVAGRSYRAAQSSVAALFVTKLFSDFRENQMVRLTDLSGLEPLAEDGQIRQQGRGEESESMRLHTHATMVSLTRELLQNDALGLFGDTVAALGQAAAHTQNDAMAALLTSPPVMKDGASPWSGDSLMGTAGALNDANLSLARQAMRTRKGPSGKIIECPPWAVVVGPELETVAEKLLASVQAHATADVNPWSNLRLIVEPRLAGRAWHVFTNPSNVPCLALAQASFATGPQIAMEPGFSVLATQWRCFYDFGVSWIDRRGALKNAGV